MTTVVAQFKELVNTSNLKEAGSILESFPLQPEPVQEAILHELALAKDATAWEFLFYLTRQVQTTDSSYPRLVQLIVDRAHLRFQFILILYHLDDTKTLREAAPLMKHILVNETDADILLATIRAAGDHKIDFLVDEIAEYLYYENRELKTQAVRTLEQIGSADALVKLEKTSGTIKCDQNILDAIAVLKQNLTGVVQAECEEHNQEGPETNSLFKDLQSTDFTTRFNAFQSITESGMDIGWKELSQNLRSDNNSLILNTLRIISRLIPEKIVGDIFHLLKRPGMDPAIRFTAYETLAAFPKLESAASIITGIDETAMHVRMAALKALDKHLSDFITAEIKKRIETGRTRGELLVETIIDAQASNLIHGLMNSDTFSYITFNYLSRKSSLSPLNHYIQTLQKRGLKATAQKFTDLIPTKEYDSKPLAIIISTSKTVHAVYEKILYTGGYASICFQSPQNAFEAITVAKPAFIISDLCFPAMTGFDLAMEIREFYPKQELPILISTLQTGFNQESLNHEYTAAQVNALAQFPIPIGMIREFIHG